MQQVFKESPLSRDFSVNRDFDFDKFVDCNGFSTFNTKEPDIISGSYSYLSSNKFSGSRSQVSVPPGFSTLNKPSPPGFTSHERMGSNFDGVSGNQFVDASSFLRNSYHSPQTGNNGSSTHIDVPYSRNPYHSPQTGNIGSSTDIEFMMQRSSPPVHNPKFSGMGNGFGPVSEAHNHIPSRIVEQTLASNLSSFSQLSLQQPRTSIVSNGQWNGWGEGKSASDMGMVELLRTESLFSKFYGGYEDSKFRMPSSGDIYN